MLQHRVQADESRQLPRRNLCGGHTGTGCRANTADAQACFFLLTPIAAESGEPRLPPTPDPTGSQRPSTAPLAQSRLCTTECEAARPGSRGCGAGGLAARSVPTIARRTADGLRRGPTCPASAGRWARGRRGHLGTRGRDPRVQGAPPAKAIPRPNTAEAPHDKPPASFAASPGASHASLMASRMLPARTRAHNECRGEQPARLTDHTPPLLSLLVR